MSSPTLLIFEKTSAGGDRTPVSPDYPLPVAPIAAAVAGSGGLTTYSNPALAATKAVVKASPASVAALHIHNPAAAITYIQFFNKLTANVTVGTTAPDLVLGIPANGTLTLTPSWPIDFSVGLVIAATTTTTGSSAPATAAVVGIFYK